MLSCIILEEGLSFKAQDGQSVFKKRSKQWSLKTVFPGRSSDKFHLKPRLSRGQIIVSTMQ